MNSQEKDQLLDKLIDFMALHKEWDSDGKGIPYVSDDNTFGVRCGPKRGGLYAAYFLMDGLQKAGLLARGRHPRTDLDTATYELTLDTVYEVYDGAKLYWNEDREIEVSISTEKSFADISTAIDRAMESARAEHRRSMRSTMDYKEKMREDRRRDRLPDIFSAEADSAFVKAYLEYRIEQEFPKSNVEFEEQGSNPELEKLLNDSRPRLEVSFDHPEGENYARCHDFRFRLDKVFTGSCAVMPVDRDHRDAMQIAGTFARLTADILDNDTPGAKNAAAKITPKFPALKQKIEAEIDNHAAAREAVAGARKGLAKNITVGAPLQVRKA
jgi:hypothetical protein